MVWIEFAEAMRVQQLEKDPDSTFVDSIMELHQNNENHELQSILKYLFHWGLEASLEAVAETVFPTHLVTFIM